MGGGSIVYAATVNYNSQYYQKNRNVILERKKIQYANDPEKYLEKARNYYVKRTIGKELKD